MEATFSILATGAGGGYLVQLDQFDGWDDLVDRLKEEVEDDLRDARGEDSEFDLDEEFDIDLFDLKVDLVDHPAYDLGFLGTEANESSDLWDFLALDDVDADIVRYYCEAHGCDFDSETLSNAMDAYYGTYDSEADFVEQFAYDTGAVNNAPWIVIDWRATWDRNLSHDYLSTPVDGGKVAIFSRH